MNTDKTPKLSIAAPLRFIGFICVLSFLAGCADDRYAIERRFYRVRKQADKIFANPHASPAHQLEDAVSALDSFIKAYPVNNLSIDAEFIIARLFIVKEEYAKAQSRLNDVINKYNKSDIICSEAAFLLGNIYQLQDRWAEALMQYKNILQKYPLTPRGTDIPVYIAQYYKTKYQPEKMLDAYKEAISQYKSLSIKYPGSLLAYKVNILAAGCFSAIKDWNSAIAVFDDIIKNYQGKVALDELLLNMALIYRNELRDEAKAKEALERLLREYPKSRSAKAADKLLKGVE